MKKIIITLVAILATVSSFASGGLPFNHFDRSLGKDNIRAGLIAVARFNPNVKAVYSQEFGDQSWDSMDKLEVGETRTFGPGTKFPNTFIEEKGRVVQNGSTAKTEVELVQIICISTNNSVWVKRDCLNLAGKAISGVPIIRRELEEVYDIRQAVNLDIEIKLSATATASATASTAPINNTMIMYMPQQQPMYMVGANPLQFMRVERPGLQIGAGYCWTRPTSIDISMAQSMSQSQSQSQSQAQAQQNKGKG